MILGFETLAVNERLKSRKADTSLSQWDWQEGLVCAGGTQKYASKGMG